MKKPVVQTRANQSERQFELTTAIIPAPSAVDGQLAQSESKHEAELQVSDMLSKAYGWLTRAVKTTNVPPLQAKQMRAYVYTIQEATKQRDLSRSIQLDAQEMARRADYALGKAIRDGQKEPDATIYSHTVYRGGDHAKGVHGTVPRSITSSHEVIDPKAKVTDFATNGELHGNGVGTPGILTIADNVTPEQFDAALDAAKDEGNLSRTNVYRKALANKSTAVSGVISVVDPDTGEFTEMERPVSKRLAQIFDTLILSATPQPSVMDMVDFDQIPAGQAAIWHGQLSEAINSLKAIDRKLAKKASK